MPTVGAIERCAYCREYVPVTYRAVGESQGGLAARVAVCEDCLGDGR